MSTTPQPPRPQALRLADAAKAYSFHRRYLQGLLISGELEGWKNEFGFWFVTIRAMERLAGERTRRMQAQGKGEKP